MSSVYLWLKALHIIAVIAWMAGMLYLPRLFVYHAGCEIGSQQSETFKIMEHRLLTIIMMPAIVVTWIAGIVLVFLGQWIGAGWFHAKFIAVLAMTVMHGIFAHWVNEFRFDRNRYSQKFYRIINEVQTILMIIIVVLATVKPF